MDGPSKHSPPDYTRDTGRALRMRPPVILTHQHHHMTGSVGSGAPRGSGHNWRPQKTGEGPCPVGTNKDEMERSDQGGGASTTTTGCGCYTTLHTPPWPMHHNAGGRAAGRARLVYHQEKKKLGPRGEGGGLSAAIWGVRVPSTAHDIVKLKNEEEGLCFLQFRQ